MKKLITLLLLLYVMNSEAQHYMYFINIDSSITNRVAFYVDSAELKNLDTYGDDFYIMNWEPTTIKEKTEAIINSLVATSKKRGFQVDTIGLRCSGCSYRIYFQVVHNDNKKNIFTLDKDVPDGGMHDRYMVDKRIPTSFFLMNFISPYYNLYYSRPKEKESEFHPVFTPDTEEE